MIIGVPCEPRRHEYRVGLTPSATQRLVQGGHTVLLEKGAGATAHFTDHRYQKSGAQVVYSREEVYLRSDLICRIGALSREELELLQPGTLLSGFQSLAVAPRDYVERLMELDTTLLGWEIVEDAQGNLPVLVPMSEMAGQMAVQLAAQLLYSDTSGRGILMGNVPGVPPPTVLILGGGTVGRAAARHAGLAGAHVIVVDDKLAPLQRVDRELPDRVVTALAGSERLETLTSIADVVIGAVLVRGGKTPQLVTEQMVRAMKPGSVIVDVSIDQGGCIETSRPSSLADPTFMAHDVVHYCVPNFTANIARTASRALANAASPYLVELADHGLEATLERHPAFGRGLYLYRGRLVHQRAGEVLGIESTPLADLLAAAAL